MMLKIERQIKAFGKSKDLPLYERYSLIKHHLLNIDYTFWAAGFPGGNDHGPEHIVRVLEYLDLLIDSKPLSGKTLNGYELYYAMMSILYHDLGILRQRKNHAEISGLFLELERNPYILGAYELEIIKAAVVSHSSSADIEEKCQVFAQEEKIGEATVRPRVIAAVVRLADELDEDHRRADEFVEKRLNIPENSEFYWEFCRRIVGIKPESSSKTIRITARFEKDHVGKKCQIGNSSSTFMEVFADKILRINKERNKVSHFLPESLKYDSLLLVVHPLEGHPTWKTPKRVRVQDDMDSSSLLDLFPELIDQHQQRINRLIATLNYPDPEDRVMSARRLGECKPDAKQAVPALIGALNDQDTLVRRAVVDTLGEIGPDAKQAVPALIEALKNWDESNRPGHIVGALAKIGAAAVPDLIGALKDESERVRCAAVNVLGDIGPDAKEAVPAFIEFLENIKSIEKWDESDHKCIVRALTKIGAAAVPALIGTLKAGRIWTRRTAAEALGRIGPDAKQAVPDLIVALKDWGDWIRFTIVGALGGIGPDAKQAVPALIGALKDQDTSVRRAVIDALGEIGPDAKQAVPAFIEFLKNCDVFDHRYVVRALTKIGAVVVPDLIGALKDESERVRCAAVDALGEMGPDAKQAVPDMIVALKDQDEWVRLAAVNAFREMGPDAKQAVPDLIGALKDQVEWVRLGAVNALGEMGPDAKQAVPDLIGALKDESERVRWAAAEALGEIGPDAKQAVPDLIVALKDWGDRIRFTIVGALGGIGPDAKQAVPDLIGALKDENALVRRAVVDALGEIGPDAKQAVPDLIGALKDENELVRLAVVVALGRIGPDAKQAVPALIGALKDENLWVYRSAVVALGEIGPDAKQAVPAFIEFLKNCNELDHRNIVGALTKIGAVVVPDLIGALKDESKWVRRAVVVALGEIGPDAKQAVPAFIEFLKNCDVFDHRYIVGALTKIGAVVVPDLIGALKDESEWVRRAAVVALGEIGPDAKQAVPALKVALKDSDHLVRRGAARALTSKRVVKKLNEPRHD